MKRRPLSMLRLYKLLSAYSFNDVAHQRRNLQRTKDIADFLKFVFEHKNDDI